MPENKENFCRAATVNDLKLLIKSLNDHDVEYFLIGGFALFTHGYERATTDIDIIVPATIESGIKVKQALMILPEQAAKDIDPKWFSEYIDDADENEHGTIRVGDEITIDVMFNACGETYETLKQHQQIICLGDDLNIKTIDLYGLLKTKQTVREKDINDRNIIQRALEEHAKEIQAKTQINPKSSRWSFRR